MNSSAYRSIALLLLLVLSICSFIESAVVGNYISWDDMKMINKKSGIADESSTQVIVVDKKGQGHSVTVQGAIDMVPLGNSERVKILIRPGIYKEKVRVPKLKPYITLIGNANEPMDTIITWNNKASDKDSNGDELGTYNSSSVTVESDYFCATGVTFQNTVVAVAGGIGMQAVALRISGDKAMFYKVRILGSQDTLLDQTGSHYFYDSYIEGSIDFIFGRAKSMYRNCILHSTAKGWGAIAAHHRDRADEDTGFSFVNCTVSGSGHVYLGRAWGRYSRIIYSYCNFHSIVAPVGWSDWDEPEKQKTAVFGEYKCRGRGSKSWRHRVAWLKNISYKQASQFVNMKFINADQWLRL